MKNLSRGAICLGAHVYMCYMYVHLDNLSDINGHRTVVKQQRTANPIKDTYGLKSCIFFSLRKSILASPRVEHMNQNMPIFPIYEETFAKYKPIFKI